MKNFKKRKYNALDGNFFKKHNSKKHKAKIVTYGNKLPIDCHEVKIILDATVVEKYLNSRNSGGTNLPSHRAKILVQKIPRLNQHVFSEKSNVMVKLEIPEDIGVNDNLSTKDSLVFADVPVKQEDDLLLLDSVDKNAFYNEEFIEPLPEDFQYQDRDNFTVEAALKNELVESEHCYEETVIDQKIKVALKDEELFVGEEFKQEESVPSYENVESIDQEGNEEIIKKKTRSSRKRKKCLDCIDCSHGLTKKPRPHLLDKVVPSNLSIQKSKTCKSQTPSIPNKPKSILRTKDKNTNQDPLHISSPAIPKPQKVKYRRCYGCVHCIYRGRRREYLIKHLRTKHSHLFSTKEHQQCRVYHCNHCDYRPIRREYLIRHLNIKHSHLFPAKPEYRVYRCEHCNYKGRLQEYLIKHMRRQHSNLSSAKSREQRVYHCDHCDYKGQRNNLINHLRKNHVFLNDLERCPNCGDEFNSGEEMQMHRAVCMLYLICKFCLVDLPTKKAMVKHMKAMHPEKIYTGEVWMEDATNTLDLTPLGQRYMEIEKFYMEMKSELIKLCCHKCAVTNDKIISRIAPHCDSCESRLLYKCQKCQETRNYYSQIWRHLKGKRSNCSIHVDLSFIDQKESSDVMDRASSNEPKRYNCKICGFKRTTRSKLYEHVLNVHLDDGIIKSIRDTGSKSVASFSIENLRLRRPKELCRIAASFPCRFCPMTYFNMKNVSDHIAIMHLDELDGRDINEFLKEAADFRKLVRAVNYKRFNDKLKNGMYKTGIKDYYYNGIESMLKPVCIICKTDGPHDRECCGKCLANLNFVCFKCDELFSKYSVAWDHVTRMCENRIFTLTVRKTREIRAQLDTSTANEELFYCDHCSFKNASKSILGNHIKYVHAESLGISNYFTCPKCYRCFGNSVHLRSHRSRCRVGFYYTCQFCSKLSSNFHVIENHIRMYHAHLFRGKDALDEILQQVIENKRPCTKKTNNRFDEFGRMIKRTFSENVKLAVFFCPKCDETVHKNFRTRADTRKCPKCNCKLHLSCKICNRDYVTWSSMNSHFQIKECGAVDIEKYDLDHSYFFRKQSL